MKRADRACRARSTVIAGSGWTWVSLVLLSVLLAEAAAGQESKPALVIAPGSVTRHHVVALGRDLWLDGSVEKNVSVVQGDAWIRGSIGGDLVVLGGDAHLFPAARVDGDVVVLGGQLHAASLVEIGGRTLAYPDAPRSLLVLLEGPALGLSALSPTVLGAKAALLAAWLLAALLLTGSFSGAVANTAEEIQKAPLRSFVTGLVAVLAVTQIVLFLVAFSSAVIGAPIAVGLVLAALALKVWGTVAVFRCTGESVRRHWLPRRLGDPVLFIVLGLLILGALKMVPWIGTVVWTAVTLVGMGAALSSKLGSREAWFAGS